MVDVPTGENSLLVAFLILPLIGIGQHVNIRNYTLNAKNVYLSTKLICMSAIQVKQMSRSSITQQLSELTEKRLNNQYSFWAAEVEFDKNTNEEIRIDYIGF